ncbi:hypothetical protein HNR19_000906 [Nocardioides thalensis]|uniref:DUF3558 domain-containing protein n=1 Tax=Nocardioides thalensis TaxID=1914755 RepID=A0A853C0R7_9ACTN|nr:hypothetical protein [Nocardioides thalensis]NYJ00208.1 hypothetical protein [Nocardioides thalensis]
MRTRLPALSLAALLVASPLLAACGGDDEGGGDDTVDGGEIGDPTAIAGPDEPSDTDPNCPFGAKALVKATGLNFLAKDNCTFVVKKGPARISVSQNAAADNETFEQTRKSYEDQYANYEELAVDGYGYAAWSDDELNIQVGYLDNGGEYRYAISAVAPADAGAEDVPGLAEQLIALTVESRDKK